MKRTLPFILVVLALLLTSLACSLPITAPPTPTATLTAPPAIPPTNTLVPPPTLTLEPPTPEPAQLPYQPAGFIVSPPGGGSVSIYDRNVQFITGLSTPGYWGDNLSSAHLAGRLSGGTANLAFIYYSWDVQALSAGTLGATNSLLSLTDFFRLVGVPGSPYIAYVRTEYTDTGLRSYLIAGDYATIASAPVARSVMDSSYNAMRPLAIADDHGTPLGIYYTFVPFGIGGDIVFEPRTSLNYLDLATNEVQTLLSVDTSPIGLSPDLTWVAYTGLAPNPITIAPLANLGSPLVIPLLPDSDRGAGDAVFSPDNQYVAWKEGSGWMMAETPNFHATIRIATTSGTVSAQIPDSAIKPLIGNPTAIWLEPAGWLDGQTLLLVARGDDYDQPMLLRVNADGSGLAVLMPGSLAGFVYP